MKLNRGINLGGFLSQCEHTPSHYANFIVEKDIEIIAKAGFDHVRLPVDYEVLETDEGVAKEEGYAKVQEVAAWCEKNSLDMIIDLHKAYGYDFNDAGKEGANDLFHNEKLQERFVQLWEHIAREFKDRENVAFELLNEVVEKDNADLWNQLIRRTVKAIRAIVGTTPIIYGGIQWNSAKTIRLLEKPEDENIIFTFHFYEPLLFTHQKAYWVPTMDPTESISYPETMEYFREKSAKLGYQGEVAVKAKAGIMGTDFMEELIKDAVDAAQGMGVGLYCGEFGVIDQAPVEDTLRWFADVDKVFCNHQIGCSVWTYRSKDFGIFDEHYDAIRADLLKVWNK